MKTNTTKAINTQNPMKTIYAVSKGAYKGYKKGGIRGAIKGGIEGYVTSKGPAYLI